MKQGLKSIESFYGELMRQREMRKDLIADTRSLTANTEKGKTIITVNTGTDLLDYQKPVEAKKFVENSFRDGVLKTLGTDIDKILPPISLFSGSRNRKKKKQSIINFCKNSLKVIFYFMILFNECINSFDRSFCFRNEFVDYFFTS